MVARLHILCAIMMSHTHDLVEHGRNLSLYITFSVSGRVPGTKKTQSPSVLVSQSGTMKTSTPNGLSSVRIGGAKSKETRCSTVTGGTIRLQN